MEGIRGQARVSCLPTEWLRFLTGESPVMVEARAVLALDDRGKGKDFPSEADRENAAKSGNLTLGIKPVSQ